MSTTIISRTIYGAAIQTRMAFRKDIPVPENTTLNEVLSNTTYVPFQPDVPTRGMQLAEPYNIVKDSQFMHMGYFVIGNMGHRSKTNTTTGPLGASPVSTAVEHLATDSGLFFMMPFACVPVTSDLTQAEQAKYGMRKTLDIGGRLYAAYYCRRLDLDSIEFKEVLVINENGTETQVPFTASSSNLFPKHPAVNGATKGNGVRSMAVIAIDFDNVEQQRIIDACALLYNDADLAQISEIAFCYGVDKPVTREYPTEGPQNPKTVTNGRMEAVAVTVGIHYTIAPVAVAAAKKKLGGAWDIGIGEPLYGNKVIK